MFNPCFNYNHELVNKLLEINSIRDFIVNAPVVLEMEVSLKREALLKSAHHSTAIEGNPLSLNQVDKLAKGIKIQGQKRATQEVLNYLNVLKYMDSYIEDGKITEKNVLKLHENITHYTLEYTYLEGQYRSEPVYVVNQEGDIVFTPPNANLVPGQIQDLLEWINNTSGELNAVISAGIIHYEFVRIHPFVDGNGRTGRALAAIYLYLRGFDVDFTLDEYYNNNRQAYYHALNSVDPQTQDLTDWLLYFLEGFLTSIDEIKNRILLFPAGAPVKIKLTEKMLKILEYVHLNGSITNSEVQKLLNISRQGAYKDLRNLMDKGIIEKKGGSRSTYYILK
ncbi:Fic family protein [Methanobacterium formicicum]|uniref:Filamentation induced by cAMP protein fic n=1 Tax=Methanobacterium formicicum TaxID=2162 RepID=A0A090JXA9_METFO|nr:Fic family protein [Methanobacterium formicicum]MDH2660408.1 Fic family protein [Methanobacterium formicicum]CEA14181.1 filamentation induced by cAMP protein fic [Methanobacterium formicicum]